MNLAQAKERIFKFINEYSTRGEIQDQLSANLADYTYKIPSYLDMAQKTIANSHYINREYRFVHDARTKISDSIFRTTVHEGMPNVWEVAGAKAYCFEVSDKATVKVFAVRNNGTLAPIQTINAFGSATGGYNSYKGIITTNITDIKSIRLSFEGSSVYNIRNVVLFTVPFKSSNDIPNIGYTMYYSMPKDFYKCLSAKIVRNGREFNLPEQWKEPNQLGISAYDKGEVSVIYAAIPQTLDFDTPDDYEFEVSEGLHAAVCYYATALLLQQENISAYYQMMQLYEEAMLNIADNKGQRQTRVKRV